MIVMIFLNNIKPKGVVKGFYYTHTFLTLMQRNKHVPTDMLRIAWPYRAQFFFCYEISVAFIAIIINTLKSILLIT